MAEGEQRNLSGGGVHQLPEILVLGPPAVFKIHGEEICSRFRTLRPWESPLPLAEFLATKAQKTLAVLTPGVFKLSAAVLQNLPSVRLVVTTSAGVDHIDLAECRRRGIAVTNTPSIFSVDVADLAVGLLIDLLRRISAGNRFVKNELWPKEGVYPLGSKLGGKKVGIVGLGSIGLEVAKRLQAFGCAISYYSRNEKPLTPYTFHSNISTLAAESDILVVCCALNEQTHHIIDCGVLLALGRDGVIVNIARGAVIDEKELVRCLQSGEIGGAGLDVFENEPNVPKALFELDNVVLSPHSAVFTEESFRDVYELICGNFEAFFLNKPLLSLVSE